MRILYCANDPVPFPKGAGVRIEATTRALVAAGARVTLVTPRIPKPAGFAERLELPGLEHIPIEVGSGEDSFIDRAMRFRRGVEQLLGRPQAWDVFWFRSIWEGWASQRLGVQLPLVYEAHGFPSMELPHHFPGLYDQPEFLGRLAFEEQELLRRARHILTPSHTGARFLATRGVARQRITVLPNTALEEAFLTPAPEPGPLRILYTGTLAPWQGLELLFEALLHLKGKLEVKLELAGTRKGRWTRNLRRLAQQLRVRSMFDFTGPFQTDELRQRMRAAHIGVAPLPADSRNTVQGCCPIKLIEFMAAGLPILSTRLPVVHELLEHEQSAWLVRPGSPWALAQGVLKLAAEPELRQQLGQAAQQRAREHFHRDRFRAQLADLVASLQGSTSVSAKAAP